MSRKELVEQERRSVTLRVKTKRYSISEGPAAFALGEQRARVKLGRGRGEQPMKKC